MANKKWPKVYEFLAQDPKDPVVLEDFIRSSNSEPVIARNMQVQQVDLVFINDNRTKGTWNIVACQLGEERNACKRAMFLVSIDASYDGKTWYFSKSTLFARLHGDPVPCTFDEKGGLLRQE